MPAARTEPVVVGMGNILYRDEGVGVYAVHALRTAFEFEPEVTLLDGAVLGFELMDMFGSGAPIIVLDALLTDAPPGTIYRLPTEQLLDLAPQFRPTAHEIEPIGLLKLQMALGEPMDVTLLGIVPADASGLEVGVTTELAAFFSDYVETVVTELRERGITVTPRAPVDIDDVLASLVAGQR